MVKQKTFQYNKQGFFIKKWNSANEASSLLKLDCSTIRKVCKNILKSCGNFIWSDLHYKNGDIIYKNNRDKPIFQYSKKDHFIKEWTSIRQASQTLNLNDGNINKASQGKLKTCGGFKWKKN